VSRFSRTGNHSHPSPTLRAVQTEETGTRLKARKKTPTPPVVVEVKVQSSEPTERGPLSPDEATEVLEEIRSLLPWGYRCFVPDLRARRGSDRMIDFEQLLEKLVLPYFAKGYSPDWERYFARDVKDKQQLMVCLSALFEAGYGCAHREGDVYQASWLSLYGNEVWPSRVREEISERDTHVVDRAELDEWTRTRLATVRASLGTVVSSFKTGAWNPQGVLKKLGYRVGTCARPPSERQARLRDALLLPTALLPRDQHALWGGAGTEHRVRAICRMLELFLALARNRKNHDTSLACKHWSEDLAWIKKLSV